MGGFKTASGLPDAIERREILDGRKRADHDLDALGAAYQEAGWLSDALDCYERTQNRERLEELKRLAIEQDPFLLVRLDHLLGVTDEEWARAGTIAAEAGRDTHALAAFERAGREAELEAARERVDAFRDAVKRPLGGRHAKPRVAGATEEADPAPEDG